MIAPDFAVRLRTQAKRGTSPRTSVRKQDLLALVDAATSVTRQSIPNRRRSRRGKVKVAGLTIYIEVGFYDDGRPGEVWLETAKEGTTMRDLLHSFATTISLGLQFGIPMAVFVEQFRGGDFSTGEGNEFLDAVFAELSRYKSYDEVADAAT